MWTGKNIPPVPPKPEWDRILAAAQKNNANEIRRLVEEEGVSPNHKNVVNQSALHIAALWGHVEAIEVLLSKGADPHAENRISGATPLHCTIQSSKKPAMNRVKCAKLLITEGGADPDQTDLFDATPLDYLNSEENNQVDGEEAVDEEFKREMELVLTTDNGEKQAELRASEYIAQVDLEGLKSYLDSDEWVNLISLLEGGETTAVGRKKKNLWPALLHRTISEILSLYQSTDDHEDIKEEKSKDVREQLLIEILEILFVMGAKFEDNSSNSVAKKDELSNDPLYSICKELASVNSSQDSSSPSLEKVALILKNHGCKISKDTTILLHDAARRGYLKTIQFWNEELGISLNEKGRQGLTPLHFAARSGKAEVVTYLLLKGVDQDLLDDRGKSALDAAIANDKADIIALLQK